MARHNAESFNIGLGMQVTSAVQKTEEEDDNQISAVVRGSKTASNPNQKRYSNQNFSNQNYPYQHCGWCGSKNRHERKDCPASNSQCNKCGVRGHFSKVCRSRLPKNTSAAVYQELFSVLPNGWEPLESNSRLAGGVSPECLKPSVFKVGVGNRDYNCLFDTGAGGNYIHPKVVQDNHLTVYPEEVEVALANSSMRTKTGGFVVTNLMVHGKRYYNVKLTILDSACLDIILGQEFLLAHKLVTFNIHKSQTFSSLSPLKIEPPRLFQNLSNDCHPIAAKSRHYSQIDRVFIKNEVERLLQEGIIEKSNSPWRAQVYVAGGGNQKRRLTIDYSETINRYTFLDAYPIPRIDEMVNNIAQYKVFSTVDMRRAYHQIAMPKEDRPYTGFAGLYLF